MEIITFLVHAYLYVLIFELLIGKSSVYYKWIVVALFGVTKYIIGPTKYLNSLLPLLLCTLLILYGKFIQKKYAYLLYLKYALITYGMDFGFSIFMGSVCGIVGGIYRIEEKNWAGILTALGRIALIVFFSKRKAKLEKVKETWVLHISFIVSIVVVFVEQILSMAYATKNNDFVYIGVACTYIAALFTILWLLDHFKMVKIQNEYADDNRQMSQKLHRSKEILPLLADYISGMEEIPDEKLREKLQEVCRDYGKELGAIEMSPALFHTTGIELVDLLIQNKVEECRRRGIEMDVFVGTTIEEDMERLDISDGELVRMIADLLRNAINAVKDMEEAVILTVVARDEHGNVEIDIHDSGKPFPPEILEKFGERGNTTWGTGNGIADLMESLRRVNASIEIIPEEEPDDVFTKQICIRFDGEGEVKVKKDQVSA